MISFCNATTIDLDTIRLMGVSVKESDNPIGYFGTGLKYAIASLLRTGHKVSLVRDGETIDFGLEESNVRGSSFNVVTMAGERLGFTTQLGRNWTPRMAFRELHSNCLDEGGVTHNTPMDLDGFGTVFKVEGSGIEEAYENRHEIFLSTDPFLVVGGVEFHNGPETRVGFYRGVAAVNTEYPMMFGYNVTTPLSLTEDRTVESPHRYLYEVRRAIVQCRDKDLLEKVLLAASNYLEHTFNYEFLENPSEEFLQVCAAHSTDLRLNNTALKLMMEKRPSSYEVKEQKLSGLMEDDVEEALGLLKHLGCHLEREDFKVVEGLGIGVSGCVRNGEILIDVKTMDRGSRYIASTLYEEWLHKTQGLRDESRAMQDMLLDRLFRFVAEYDRNGSE